MDGINVAIVSANEASRKKNLLYFTLKLQYTLVKCILVIGSPGGVVVGGGTSISG
jgi:hypothetical protein